MTGTAKLVERLRSRLAMATPGPWELQDGNSLRRIGTPGRDGSVCRPSRYSEREPSALTLDGDRIYADLTLAVEAVNALPDLLEALTQSEARRKADVAEAVAQLAASIRASGMSVRQIAREAGVSPTTVMRARDGECQTITPLLKIEKAIRAAQQEPEHG